MLVEFLLISIRTGVKKYHIVVLICISLIITNGELRVEVHDTVQETGSKTIPKKNKCQKAKWLSDKVLQKAMKRRQAKKQRRKGKIYPFGYRVPKSSKEI